MDEATVAAAPPEAAMLIYLAAPLFSQMQRAWNRSLAGAVEAAEKGWRVVLPQDFRPAGRFNDARHYPTLFRRCLDELAGCDAVLAVLDGPDVDSGTAFEMGVAHALGKTIVGLRTDYRPGADHGVNMMCARACDFIAREFAFQEDARVAAEAVVRRLRKAARRRAEAHEGESA